MSNHRRRRTAAAVLSLLVFAVPSARAGEPRESVLIDRYVTLWDPHPVLRVTHPEALDVNAVRYRVLPSRRSTADWTDCRVVSLGRLLPGGPRPWDDPRASWRMPLGELAPGRHRVEFDLRTPNEAVFVEHEVEVPIVARFTGRPISGREGRDGFPQARFGTVPQDGASLWFAWDRRFLYAASPDGAIRKLKIDCLPVVPETIVAARRVPGFLAIPWEELRPAGPHLGQVLRIEIRTGKRSEGTFDLLFTGSGIPMYFSANMVSGKAGHDDQGAPVPVLKAMQEMSGFNEWRVGAGLGAFYPRDPGTNLLSRFDFSGVLRDPDLYRPGLVVAGVNTFVEWARGREYDPAFWAVAEPFVEAFAAEMARHGVDVFSAGYNEPELFYRSDREAFFVNDLDHVAAAIRRGNPKARIIAGKFSGPDPNIIRNMFAAGFRDNFDILDVHAYANDPRIGCDMGGVVASHETLVELGMGEKRIYLGEGWGPARDLPGSDRQRYDDPVPFLEADLMRRYFQNGYRCLVTPRDDYNPEWVLGARFFTLNDNMGSTYWRYNAVPHTNEVGEVDYWLLSHLRFGNLDDVKPSFWDGGLIDFQGRPKGDWFFDFPPALPRLFVRAEGAPEKILPGRTYDLEAVVVNMNDEPTRDLSLGIRSRTYKWEGDLVAEAGAATERDELAPGEIWRIPIRIAVNDPKRGPFRIALEVDYRVEETSYVADDVARARITDPLTVRFDPPNIILDGGETKRVAAIFTNESPEPRDVRVAVTSAEGVVLEPENGRTEIALEPGRSERVHYLVSWPEGPAGAADVKPEPDLYEALTVRKTFHCPRLPAVPRIDGDLSDWPATRAGHVTLGRRLERAELPENVPFPLPPPPEESALRAERSAPAERAESGSQRGPRAFGAEVLLGWNEEGLAIGLIVEDPEQAQEHFGLEIWRGDSVQIAVDPLGDGAGIRTVTPGEYLNHAEEEGYSADDHEFGLALTRSGNTLVRIHGPAGSVKGPVETGRLAVRRLAGSTVYEAFIPWEEIGRKGRAGDRMAVDILVNNFDGENRSTLGWAGAIGGGKYPSRYVPMILEPGAE